MKGIIILTCFLLISSYLIGQIAPDTLWTRTYPAYNGKSIIEAENNSLIAVGFAEYGLGNSDMYFLKVNQSGQWIWAYCLIHPYITGDIAEDICKAQDGNFVVTGQYRGKPILTKITSDGDSLWFKQYPNLYLGRSYSLDISENGELAFCGTTFDSIPIGYNTITDSSGTVLETTFYPFDITSLDIAKCYAINFLTNNEIAVLLNAIYSTNPNDIWGNSYLVKTDLQGNELLTITMDYYSNLDFIYSDNSEYVVAADTLIMKYNSNGDLLFVTDIPFYAKSIIQKDNDFIIAGNIDGNANVMRIDEDGNQIWHAIFESVSFVEINCIISTEDGGFALTGRYGNQFYIMKLGSDIVSNSDEYVINSTDSNLQNYPNPFNPTTTIKFSIQNNSKIDLSIYNIKGQKIKTLINNELEKGNHTIHWKGNDESSKSVSSGIYYYKLNVNGKTEAVKKCLLLK